jgi:hypothetical protein
MPKDGKESELTPDQAAIAEGLAEQLVRFCEENGIDPRKIESTHWILFYDTQEVKDLLGRK